MKQAMWALIAPALCLAASAAAQAPAAVASAPAPAHAAPIALAAPTDLVEPPVWMIVGLGAGLLVLGRQLGKARRDPRAAK